MSCWFVLPVPITRAVLLQAIELSAEALASVKFIKEKKLILKFFDEISQDSGRYCFGVDDTMKVAGGERCRWLFVLTIFVCWSGIGS